MQAAAAMDTTTKKLRSVLTNDPRRLAGVSMHTPEGRRFKDIVDAILVEFGGDADVTRVRELASLKFSHEMIQAQVIAGDLAKTDDLVRLSNLIGRVEKDLRRRKAARTAITPPAHSLANIIARHRAADEAARRAAAATPAPPAGDGDNGDGR
ncbi:hypothetical protein [Methylocystis rosea]|uniref:Terminase small subunit n=1 Tax=Methylocystis rosea TaxID=173366 RepID=A0A3G8M3L8_9HYPH|nr:hypothetical protein [Methylocystis rosea]AZG75905.1 hypothetical protein EHO51_03665 [Methylocystis rosea]